MKVVGYNPPPEESKILKFIKRKLEEYKKAHILYEATKERKVECPRCHAIISYRAHETDFWEHHHDLNCPSYWCDKLIEPCPSCHYQGIQVTKEKEINAFHPLQKYYNLAISNYPVEYRKRLAKEEKKDE